MVSIKAEKSTQTKKKSKQTGELWYKGAMGFDMPTEGEKVKNLW